MDLGAAVERLAARGGPGLRPQRPLPGGGGGGGGVRGATRRRAVGQNRPPGPPRPTRGRGAPGRRLVAKTVPTAWLDHVGGLVARVERLRALGYPIPGHELRQADDDTLLVLQELVPGEASADVSTALLDRLVELNALQAGQ